jgi:hypothetical protein
MTSKRLNWLLVILPVILMLVAAGCDGGGTVRKYKEKKPPMETAASPHGKMMPPTPQPPSMGDAHAHTGAHFKWETPEGWDEKKDSSGFRLATFTIKSDGKEALCTVIPLPGEAGGVKANVTRWLGQVAGKSDIPATDEMIKKILDQQETFLTKGGYPAVLIDFTPETPKPTDPSIIATIIKVGGSSVFVKMTGEKSLLANNKSKFKSLCHSFSSSTPSPSPESTEAK